MAPPASSHNTKTSRITQQLLDSQRRAHAVDIKERDRLEGLRKAQRETEQAATKRSRLDTHRPSSAGDSPTSAGSGGKSSSKEKASAKRFVAFCNSSGGGPTTSSNGEKLQKFCGNAIHTSRYSLSPLQLNFVVYKNLWEQFHRRANWFFLFVGILELVPQLGALSTVTLVTLAVVLLLGMARSMVEDLKRQAADRIMNNQTVLALKSFGDSEWRTIRSSEVEVGDIILLESSAKNVAEAVPCDLVLLSTSEIDDTCAVQSAHIDGEAKWTMKRALPITKIQNTANFLDGDELGERFVGSVAKMFEGATITCGSPDGNIHDFNGVIRMRGSLDEYHLRIPQLLLRGTQLRKAKWVVGACVYTGNETKALMDHELPTRKWSRVETVVNKLIFISLMFYTMMVIAATVTGVEVAKLRKWYLPEDTSTSAGTQGFVLLLTFIIYFDNAIPISLYVTLEIIELVASFLIEMDLAMYDSTISRRTAIRSPELLPDLGQVNYLFCDKTGTITKNELSLRKFSVRGTVYGTGTTEIGRAVMKHGGAVVPDQWRRTDEEVDNTQLPFYDPRFDEETWFTHVAGPHLERLFVAMALCHTANLSTKYVKLRKKLNNRNMTRLQNIKKYDGESPDECALCEAARKFGVEFVERRGDAIIIESRNGSRTSYTVRDVLPFTSERMRMSVLLELPDGKFKLICKGADSAVLPLAVNDHHTAAEKQVSSQLALEGLRTLVFAERELSRSFVEQWLKRDTAVKNAGDFYFDSAGHMREKLASEIECQLNIIGVTGMEDMLQFGVPDCVAALRGANIRTWLVTGDGREAAINIGYSCGLIPVDAHIIELYGLHQADAKAFNEQLHSPVAPADAAGESSNGINNNNNNKDDGGGVGNNAALAKSMSSEALKRHNSNQIVMRSGSFSRKYSTFSPPPETTTLGGSVTSSPNRGSAGAQQQPTSTSRGGGGNNNKDNNNNQIFGTLLTVENDDQDDDYVGALGTLGALSPLAISLNSELGSPLLPQKLQQASSKSPGSKQHSPKNATGGNTGGGENNNSNGNGNKTDDPNLIFVAVIDGVTFQSLTESSDDVQKEAYQVLSRCSSVLCARFSSSQKAKVVQFCQHWNKKLFDETVVTVAVGDGTNDIPMLRAANVGIGMFGVENFDAANAGDFAIGQFWFLQRLLLNHGRNSYRRFALVIKYFTYKNLLFVLMLFFFAMQSDWSPQSFIPSRLLSMYNILFTSLPIIIVGIMDRDIFNTDFATRDFPELYWPGQGSIYLNLRGLLPWVANAGMHAVIIYFFTQLIFDDQISNKGVNMGGDASALTSYTTVIVMANVHLGFHLSSFNSLIFLAFWLSVIGWFFFMMLYSALPPAHSTNMYRAFNNIGFQVMPWATAFIAIQLCSAREAFANYLIFNVYSFSRMSLKRIIQLADSVNAGEASTKHPYELRVLENAAKAQAGNKSNARNAVISSGAGAAKATVQFNDEEISDQLNFFLQFKDGETEEQFIESFLGKLTRYKVGAIVATIFSSGITLITAISFFSGGETTGLEIIGWGTFSAVSVVLLGIFFYYDAEKVRPVLHQVMLVALLIAFAGMSIANFVASQRAPDTHPVSMAVAVFGLLVVVRPPLVHILQYLVLGVTSLAMWYQIFRVKIWTVQDIMLRTIEFIIVFIISLIGLVVGEKFDRKLYVMQMAIKKSLATAAEAERRSLVLLNNVLPAGIVAEMSNNRVSRNLSDFGVTLPAASVLQSDIVSFTLFSSTKQPHAVVEMLNSMFKKFDAHVTALGIEKIKTVGDAYVCAAGVPCADRNHAEKILTFGLRMHRSIRELNREGVPSIPNLDIKIRVGAACGPVRAGVIALEKMRYELFGAVAEECEKMEQTGMPDRVQTTRALYECTSGLFTYEIIRNEKTGKNQYFLKDTGSDPFFSEMPASQLVTTNARKERDRFRILEDDDTRRCALLKQTDPAIGGKLERANLHLKDPELEAEFLAYYSRLADTRVNTETAQSTIMYALVASIVALFAGSLHPVVILQIVIASLLALTTVIRVGIPFIKDLKSSVRRLWIEFERQVFLGGLDEIDHHQHGAGVGVGGGSGSFSSMNSDDIEMSRRSSNASIMDDINSDPNSQYAAMLDESNKHLSPLLEDQSSFSEKFLVFMRKPTTTVYVTGILTLCDPIIVLFAVDAEGIGRGSVFITLAAASFIFSQMHLLFIQKIILATLHLIVVSVAFFVRTAVYRSFNGSRDGGDYVGVVCCYILCVGAAYTTERSVRKAFVASKRVERRNAEIGRTLHLCEKLLANSIPVSIIRRLQEAPDRAVVDEIPEASVLFLYVDGVIPNEYDENAASASPKSSPGLSSPELDAGAGGRSGTPIFLGANNNGSQGNAFGSSSTGSIYNLGSSTQQLSREGSMLPQTPGTNPSGVHHRGSLHVDINVDPLAETHGDDDTPDVVKKMNDVFYVIDALCQFHMVEKIKTLPFLVVSGCPEPLAKHCYRLACLARDCLTFADYYNSKIRDPKDPPLRIRAGINTGRVTAGVLGTSKFVYDVFGDTVNLASRLASNAKWGTAACSAASRVHLQRELVTCTDRGKLFLKGKGEQQVFEVNRGSLRVPTPEFIEDIDSYLATLSARALGRTKDPHTARWSMKSSVTSDYSNAVSGGGGGIGGGSFGAAPPLSPGGTSALSSGLDAFVFPTDSKPTDQVSTRPVSRSSSFSISEAADRNNDQNKNQNTTATANRRQQQDPSAPFLTVTPASFGANTANYLMVTPTSSANNSFSNNSLTNNSLASGDSGGGQQQRYVPPQQQVPPPSAAPASTSPGSSTAGSNTRRGSKENIGAAPLAPAAAITVGGNAGSFNMGRERSRIDSLLGRSTSSDTILFGDEKSKPPSQSGSNNNNNSQQPAVVVPPPALVLVPPSQQSSPTARAGGPARFFDSSDSDDDPLGLGPSPSSSPPAAAAATKPDPPIPLSPAPAQPSTASSTSATQHQQQSVVVTVTKNTTTPALAIPVPVSSPSSPPSMASTTAAAAAAPKMPIPLPSTSKNPGTAPALPVAGKAPSSAPLPAVASGIAGKATSVWDSNFEIDEDL